MKFLLFAVAVAACFHPNTSFAEDAPAITQVTESVYRGRRPDEATIAQLAQMKIKTILDLEDDEDAIAAEIVIAEHYGIKVISTPMSGFWRPKDEQVNESLAVLTQAENLPIFVHCQHGQDRTGLIIGLFRVREQHVTPSAAYEEMLTNGFHPMLFFLRTYFEEKAG